MPGFYCCVPGCYNNSSRDKTYSFYNFPKNKELRDTWLRNISRAGNKGRFSKFVPTIGHRVCSAHFIGGKKTMLRALTPENELFLVLTRLRQGLLEQDLAYR